MLKFWGSVGLGFSTLTKQMETRVITDPTSSILVMTSFLSKYLPRRIKSELQCSEATENRDMPLVVEHSES